MIFSRHNEKLVNWYSRLPDKLRKELDSTSTDNWDNLILNWLSSQIKKTDFPKTAKTIEEKKLDSRILKELVDFIYSRERVSTQEIADKFNLDNETVNIILTNLSELGYLSVP